MKTSKQYTQMLKSGILTKEVVGACIFSINKRAKNYRDKANEARMKYHGKYSDGPEERMQELYCMKEKFLLYFRPKEIHVDGRASYYYYEIGGYKFHQPVHPQEIVEDLPVVKIPLLYNQGADTDDLLSLQFCRKVLELIQNGCYSYIDE